MDKYGMVLRGMASNGLEIVFNAEWIQLSSADSKRVLNDFLDASHEDGATLNEYKRRIGAGNLQAYADTLAAGERYRAKHAA